MEANQPRGRVEHNRESRLVGEHVRRGNVFFSGPELNAGKLSDESNLEFVGRAAAELVVSFTDPRDHNLHALINGLLEAIEHDRARIAALEKRPGEAATDR